jgi:hypothetical protein
MAALAKKLNVGPAFSAGMEMAHVEYDFSVDAGAVGALDIFEAAEDIVITHFHSKVMTACTSDGSATLKVGVSGGTTDLFMNTTQGAVTSLTANAVILPLAVEGTPNALPIPYKLASGGKLIQTIGTAALKAGKVKYVIGYVKA